MGARTAMTDDPTSPTVTRSQGTGSENRSTIHWLDGDDDDKCQYVSRMERNGNVKPRPLSIYHPDAAELCSECWPAVPEKIEVLMQDDEVENMRLFRGWALGNIEMVKEGEVTRRIEGCWIELFNGVGRAGKFGGVKAYAAIDPESELGEKIPGLVEAGGYFETYAFATREAFEASSQLRGWYVDEWVSPPEPVYGEAAP